MKFEGTASPRHSIRFKVLVMITLSFIAMFVLLYIVFSVSMHSMLTEREKEAMRNQADMARNMLIMSVDTLPNLTKEWASLSYTYDYATGQSDTIYNSHFLPDDSYNLNKVNVLAVLDNNGDILFEKYYSYIQNKQLQKDADMADLYQVLGNLSTKTYNSDASSDMGVYGFINSGSDIYYVNVHPIAGSDGELQPAGNFLFARIINSETLGLLTEDTGVTFDVADVNSLEFSEADIEGLNTGGSILKVTGDTLSSYTYLYDIFGNPSLLVSVSNYRTIYTEGQQFINLVILLVAIGCTIVLAGIIKLLNKVVLNPLTSLANDVNNTDLLTLGRPLKSNDDSREMFDLVKSINSMIERIRVDSDTIKKKNDSLYFNANFDSLTGLNNRLSATQMLKEAIVGAKESRTCITVFYLDIDRFKYVNDTLGHHLGDYLIKSVANRLKCEVGAECTISRSGGDKFLLFICGLGGEKECQHYVKKILAVFEKPFKIKERTIVISASVGSSAYPADGNDAHTLINNAEIAMYEGKELGGRLYMPYRQSFREALNRKVSTESLLRTAINDNCSGFEVYFQPKVSVKNGKIQKCEALMRWNCGEDIILPADFIAQAEETDLIVPLTWWLINECCRKGKQLSDLGYPTDIAINIPAQVLLHYDFIETINQAIADSGMDVEKIDIEITEGTLLEDVERVNSVFGKLHSMGMEISVDDFGTGYSSLSYLNKLAMDRIKIDRSFVSRISKDKDSRAIVKAIMAMSKSLKMIVTAEGVENSGQYNFLATMGCDEIQGFYISKPLCFEDYIDFICKWEPLAVDSSSC